MKPRKHDLRAVDRHIGCANLVIGEPGGAGHSDHRHDQQNRCHDAQRTMSNERYKAVIALETPPNFPFVIAVKEYFGQMAPESVERCQDKSEL